MSVATRPSDGSRVRKRGRSTFKKKLKVFFSLSFLLFAVVFITGSFLFYQRLQAMAPLVSRIDSVVEELNSTPSTIMSADGVVLFSMQTEYRKPVRRIDIPQKMVNAILAAEDKRFYDHPGVDPYALGRIAFLTLKSGEASQGASTLTMQIAKMVFTSPKKTLDRKLDDMALAVEIEQTLTKDQILELYLNKSYFGEGAHGIVAAADTYYGKTLDELTISECAMLARCVRRPSDENPFNDLDASIRNRDVVLKIERDEKMISQKEYEDALKEPVKLRKDRPQVLSAVKKAPYFVDYVLKKLRDDGIDIHRGGYTVTTTLNYKLQKIAEERAKVAVNNLKGDRVNRIAFLCTDTRGRIIAMVPDTDYSKRQFNMCDMPPGRQPGSSFKPFVYAAGIERGVFAPTSYISCQPFRYTMPDANGVHRIVRGGTGQGTVSIARALSSSNNTVAVRAISMVGPQNVVDFAHGVFGFERSNLPPVEPLALGAGEVLMTEMASAYSVFQNGGDRMVTYGIERVKMPDGTVVMMQPEIRKNVLSTDTAQAMDRFLRGVVNGGTGHNANVVKNARGKTGTTSSNKDAWFCGYTDKLLGICWISHIEDVKGRAVSMPMSSYIMGGTGAAPAWADIMKRLQDAVGEEERSFRRAPEGDKPDETVIAPDVQDPNAPTVDPNDPNNPNAKPGDVTVAPPLLVDPNAPKPNNDGTNDPASTPGQPKATDPKAPKKPADGKKTTQVKSDKDVVYVTVCADSGQLATIYCPETEKRPFIKGTEPKHKCPIHGPSPGTPHP